MDAQHWKTIIADRDAIMSKYVGSDMAAGRERGYWWVVWAYLGWAYFAKNGAELLGYSFSQRYGEWLLVVKAKVDDARVVGFMSGSTPTSCIEKVLTRLDVGEMRFTPDKFA